MPDQRLPNPYRSESRIVTQCLESLNQALDWLALSRVATPWVQAVRDNPPPFWAMESLLKEYPISSAEGLALMRLAEALLRVPCLLYTSPSPRDRTRSRMPSSA